ncbi:MAG: SAM-dependent methyltransferase, partial [Oscillospiraceae bacterium]|nr:SAM-dependent methyltransferase [Oscillospiraceae bacterium]
LFTKEEQKAALSEALRVTKKGGIVFAAYCMGDAAVLMYGFGRGKIHELIEKCKLNTETFDTFSDPWDIFELYRKENIDELMTGFDVERLHFLASDGYANHIRQKIDEMDEKTYELFIKYHLATCEREDMIGYSNHTLDIFRKK